MNKVVSASPPTTTLCSSFQSKTQSSFSNNALSSVPVIRRTLSCATNLKLKSLSFGGPKRITVQCNSSAKPGPPAGSGDGDSRTVLDAFFLGKAVAEALNERIESAVGEFLSTVGRLQAEQQKQVQEFQEDVFERAKKAKEKAALEAMETRRLVPKSTTVNATSVSAAAPTSPATTDNDTPASPSDPITPDDETDPNPADKDPGLGVSNED